MGKITWHGDSITTSRLNRNSTDPRISVNFDPALVLLLREVRYFLLYVADAAPVPSSALKVSSL